jgi:phage terminase large subunit
MVCQLSNPVFNINLPQKLLPIFQLARYKILYGGRSSGKSYGVACRLITRAIQQTTKILCVREYQSSIADSTYADLVRIINEYNLHQFFTIQKATIISYNGSEFIFKGVRRDIFSIKSMGGIDICFVEEADTITRQAWDIIIPTIRKEGSEIILAFNPSDKTTDTYQRFIANTPPNSIKIQINYTDNPFNSQTTLVEIEHLKKINYNLYEHVYLGIPLDMTQDVIFKGRFKVERLNIRYNSVNWVNLENKQKIYPLYGMDFGFSADPTAIVELFLIDDDTVYIHREIYEHGLLPTKYRERIKEKMPEAINKKFWADNSRPDTIAQLNHDGLIVEGATKGKGSVEAGIEWLLGKNIIINPDCKNTIYEFYNYKYKTDKNTGEVTTDIIDANNHILDGIRYSLTKQITSNNSVSPDFWSKLNGLVS